MAEDVKSLVEKITLEDRSEILTHRRVYRPWGSYDAIDQGPGFQVKRIFVDPGKKLAPAAQASRRALGGG